MNKFFDYLNSQFGNAKQYNLKQVLYSVGIAIICWVVISMTEYPTNTTTISNIDLNIDLSGTSAEANDLTLISQDIEKVKIQVQGDRSKTGTLKSEDFTAYAVIENVTDAGTYELSIEVKNNSGVDCEIKNIYPQEVMVEFDKYITKAVPIVVNSPNITTKSGYMMDENSPKVTPETVNITGSKTQVDSIASFKITINQIKELDNYYTYHSTNQDEWTILNADGGEVDNIDLILDTKDFQIDYQAYMTKTLKLTYNLTNAPSSDFKPNFTMSDTEITVASSDSSLETTEEIFLGDIDMRDVDLNFSKTFDIELQPSYRNISGIEQVTISLNSNNYKKREFSNLTNFSITNAPSDYNIEVLTSNVSAEFIGPSDIMDYLNENDITIKIDLSNTKASNGLITTPVTIQAIGYNGVWCIGKYSVVLRFTKKTIESETTTQNIVDDVSYTTTD